MKIRLSSLLSIFFVLIANNAPAQDFWELVHQFEIGTRITGIAVDSNGSIYISGNSDYPDTRGIFRSDDDGLTWQQKNNDICRSIAIDNEDNLFTITNSACYKSTNHGETWQMKFSTAPYATMHNDIICGFDSIVLAGGSYMNGIIRSGDHGETWKVVLSLDHNNEYIELISGFCFGTNGAIYASTIMQLAPGTPGNVYVSYDYGNTWQVFLSEGYPEAVGFDNQGRLLVGQAGDGLYRYDFNTTSWEHPLANYTTPVDILVLPNDKILLALDYYPNANGGVMMSVDGGETYEYINSGFDGDGYSIGCLVKDAIGRILFKEGSQLIRSIDTIYDHLVEPALQARQLDCYPNPFHNQLTLKIPVGIDQTKDYEVTLTNSIGHEVYRNKVASDNSIKIISDWLRPGLYYLTLRCGNTLYTQKLIHY